jgi:hypothetical protein
MIPVARRAYLFLRCPAAHNLHSRIRLPGLSRLPLYDPSGNNLAYCCVLPLGSLLFGAFNILNQAGWDSHHAFEGPPK